MFLPKCRGLGNVEEYMEYLVSIVSLNTIFHFSVQGLRGTCTPVSVATKWLGFCWPVSMNDCEVEAESDYSDL